MTKIERCRIIPFLIIASLYSCATLTVDKPNGNVYQYDNLNVDFINWKNFYFHEKLRIEHLNRDSIRDLKQTEKLKHLSFNEFNLLYNSIEIKNNDAVVYIMDNHDSDSLKKSLLSIDFEDRIDWNENLSLSQITREMYFSPFYRHSILSVDIAPNLVSFTNLIFDDIKHGLKKVNNRFYRNIENTQLEIRQTTYGIGLQVNVENQKIQISPSLLRAMLLYVGYDELDGLEITDDPKINAMLRSLIYVRFFDTMAFLIIHELSHVYFDQEEIFGSESQCDCIAYQLSNKIDISQRLEVQFESSINISPLPLTMFISNAMENNMQKFWGVSPDFSMSKRNCSLNHMVINKNPIIFCKKLIDSKNAGIIKCLEN